MRNLCCLLLGLLLVQFGRTSGFELHLLGARALGMANAQTGLALDAGSVYFNPGAMGFCPQNSFVVGGHVNVPFSAYLAPGFNKVPVITETQINTPPYFYGAWRPVPNGNWVVGVAINSPFSADIRWPETWVGRFISLETELSSLFIQPTVGYRFNEMVSVGAGLVIGNAHLRMKRALGELSGLSPNAIPTVSVAGRALSVGLNAGIMVRLNEFYSLGLRYRSGLNYRNAGGQAIFDVPTAVQSLYPDSDVRTQIVLPSVWTLGVGYRPTSQIRLDLDISRTGWSQFDSLNFRFDRQIPFEENYQNARNYRSTWSIDMGGEGDLGEKFMVRMGAFYRESPIQDQFVSPELPDGNRVGFSGGGSWAPLPQFSVDVALHYETTGERTSFFAEQGFGGTYQSNRFAFGLGVRFSY